MNFKFLLLFLFLNLHVCEIINFNLNGNPNFGVKCTLSCFNCAEYQHCINGNCVNNTFSNCNNSCLPNFTCLNGVCLDECNNTCSSLEYCILGGCTPIFTCGGINCSAGQTCINNTCVDNLTCNNSCRISQQCINAICVDNTVCIGSLCFSIMNVPVFASITIIALFFLNNPSFPTQNSTLNQPLLNLKADSLGGNNIREDYNDEIMKDLLENKLGGDVVINLN